MIDWDSCVLWLDSRYLSEKYWWDRSKYSTKGKLIGASFREDSIFIDRYSSPQSVVSLEDPPQLRINDEISYEIVFYPIKPGYLLIKRNWDNWSDTCGLYWNVGNDLAVRFYGNDINYVSSTGVYNENEKVHVIVTAKQGEKVKFYKNGSYLNQADAPAFSGDGEELAFGARPDTGGGYTYFLHANVYLIRVFHKILSGDEIKVLARMEGF